MKNKVCLILIGFLLLSNTCISQKKHLIATEENDINLFNDFKNYILEALQKREDINDTMHLNYIISHYLFITKQSENSIQSAIDNTTLKEDQLISLKKELSVFYDFMRTQKRDNLANSLTLMPTRLSVNTLIYNKLTKFQKENTYILYDKLTPNKVLGYVLFIPPVKNIIKNSRIWSWTLVFKFGKYMFRSVTGEEGYEYIFSPENFKK